MGEIWEARDTQLDCTCAVKFILQHLALESDIRCRFTREAKVVAHLQSPHAVHILGVGAEEQMLYLAMELLHGETLRTRLTREGPLSQEVTLRLIEQVADALEEAHAAGIVHRDLKPDNIWLWSGKKLFVKVLDFGVAKFKSSSTSLHTATGSLVGTPYYMSPEQARGVRDLDSRSDVWSLAVIAVECMTGRRPFESEGLGDLLLKIVAGPIPPLSQLGPELPPSLQSWWERALARDPERRFQTATELVEVLRQHLDIRSAASSRHSSVEPSPSHAHGTLDPVQSGTFPPVPGPHHASNNIMRWSALSAGVLVAVLSIVFGARALRGFGAEERPGTAVAPLEAAVVPAPTSTPPPPSATAAASTPPSAAPASATATPTPPPASQAVPDVPLVKVAGGPPAPSPRPAATESAREAKVLTPSVVPAEASAESTAASNKPRPSTHQRLELDKPRVAAPEVAPEPQPPPPAKSDAPPPKNDNAARLGLD